MSMRDYLTYIQIGNKVYEYNHSMETFFEEPAQSSYGVRLFDLNRYINLNIRVPVEEANEFYNRLSYVNEYAGSNVPESLKIKITNNGFVHIIKKYILYELNTSTLINTFDLESDKSYVLFNITLMCKPDDIELRNNSYKPLGFFSAEE